jgi:hypothetical protein
MLYGHWLPGLYVLLGAYVRDTVLAYSYVLFEFNFPYYVLNKGFLCILL